MSVSCWNLGEGFQATVVSLCLRDPDFLPQHCDLVHHSYFENESLSALTYLITDYFNTSGHVPTKDVVEVLIREYGTKYDKDRSAGTEAHLTQWMLHLYERPIGDANFIREKLISFARRSALTRSVKRACELLEQGDPEAPDKVLSDVEEACKVGSTRDLGINFQEIACSLPRMLLDSPVFRNKVPTGFKTIDEDLGGGLGAGQLGVILAPPNKGKSTLLTVLGRNAAVYFHQSIVANPEQPKRCVVHITCEMDGLSIAQKYFSACTGVSLNDIVKDPDDSARIMATALDTLSTVQIKYFLPGTATVEEVKWFVANIVMSQGLNPGVILLDYADRLRGGEDDRFKWMGKIYDTLIEIGHKFSCPVWTASQVNRVSAKASIIDMTGAAESWKKNEVADLVITVNQEEPEEKAHIARLYTAKVRHGMAKKVYYISYHPNKVHAEEISEVEAIAALEGISKDTGGGGGVRMGDLPPPPPIDIQGLPFPMRNQSNGNGHCVVAVDGVGDVQDDPR